tara:strand:+ start:231 stop:842 length:612 start_codon:yes stop_codon:yes gene_type:complete
MSDKTHPLDQLGQANEESYHRSQDAALIDELRKRLQNEAQVESIKAETGVADDAVLARLAELGITSEMVPVLHLVPLFDVAWADGEVQDGERVLLNEAATATGITEGPARALFEKMLSEPPDAKLVAASMAFISSLLHVLPEGEAEAAKNNLIDLSLRVADACGGVFGLWGRIEESERSALNRVAERLSAGHPDAAKSLLDRL